MGPQVVLLLTGSIQSAKNMCNSYLTTFSEYEWTWKEDIEKKYQEFKGTEPSLDDFESKLKEFVAMESKVEQLTGQHQISALMLKTGSLALDLKGLADKWKSCFAKALVRHKCRWLSGTPGVAQGGLLEAGDGERNGA